MFYELYLCITALKTIYCIYTPPAHFGVFPLHYFPTFHCHNSQLTCRVLGKDLYYFKFVLLTPIFISLVFFSLYLTVSSTSAYQTRYALIFFNRSHSSSSHPSLSPPQNRSQKRLKHPSCIYYHHGVKETFQTENVIGVSF